MVEDTLIHFSSATLDFPFMMSFDEPLKRLPNTPSRSVQFSLSNGVSWDRIQGSRGIFTIGTVVAKA